MATDTNSEKRARHLLRLRAMGLTDTKLLKTIEETPRENFVAPHWQQECYTSRSLPIDCGQDMTSAEDVSRIVDALRIDESSRILELGTGSGYQTSILARLGRQVVTVERYATLLDAAKEQLEYLNITNVDYQLLDGAEGVPKLGPYDRIVVNFAYLEPPRIFLEQMTMGARLVVPIALDQNRQMMTAYTKIGSRFDPEPLFEVRFAPAIPGVAQAI